MNKTSKNFKKRPNHITTSSFTTLSPKAPSSPKLNNDITSIPIEKYNSKMNMWSPMYLTLSNTTLHFLERPSLSTSKQQLTLNKKTKLKFYSLYKKTKPNVISIQFDATSLSNSLIEDANYILLISFKNKQTFKKVQTTLTSLLFQSITPHKKNPTRNNKNLRMKYTQSFRGCKTQTEMYESNDNENKQPELIDMEPRKQNRGLLDMFKKNCPMKKKAFQKGNNRTKSCLDFSKEQNDVYNNRRELSLNFVPANVNTITINKNQYASENGIVNIKKRIPIAMIRNSGESDNLTANTSNNGDKEENNTSLISLLNQMVTSSHKKNCKGGKKHYRSHTHTGFSTNSNKAIEKKSIMATPINTKKMKCLNEKMSKRKEQINKIIDLSYISENCSFMYNKNDNDMSFNQKCLKKDELFIDINNANSNNDLSNSNVVTLGNITSSSISSNDILPALNEIELKKIYFYDPYILKQFLIKHNLTSKHLGLLYNNVNDNKIKTILLSEMIARISAKFLSSSIIKSLEINLKEKEINNNFVTKSPLHPHSIEYCVLDVFNTFLSVNKKNLYFNELYMKVLPVYLKEHFGLEEQKSLKDIFNFVSFHNTSNLPYLFALMQYHNKIYFNSNLTVKFSSLNYPLFEASDIKYISPTNINKWHIKASEFITSLSCNKSNKEKEENDNNRQTLTTTNIKRIKHFTHITDDYNKISQNFKEFDISNNDNRIYLLNSIYTYITHKQFFLALKLCDFYLQKYTDTLFLNPIIYINLSEIYYEINDDISYAKLFFNKAETVLNWLFPDNQCHFIFELNYRYLLILLKQNDDNIKSSENEIEEQMIKCEQLSEKYFNKIHYKLKIQKLLYVVNYVWKDEEEDIGENEIKKMFDEIKNCLNEMVNENGDNKNECGDWLYWNLFIDIFKGIKNTPDDIIAEMIQLLHQSNKRKNDSI